jgi:hypothetical protein
MRSDAATAGVCSNKIVLRIRQHLASHVARGPWPGEAIGRSRGGPTTKIHLACDGQGRPLAFTVTAGNVNDRTQFEQVIAPISVRRRGPGRGQDPARAGRRR